MKKQAPGGREAHTEACFLAGAMASAGLMLEQSVPDGFHPMERTMLEQLLKNCSPSEGSMLDQFMRHFNVWEGLHAGTQEQHEEKRAAEPKCYEPATTPIPHPPAPLR